MNMPHLPFYKFSPGGNDTVFLLARTPNPPLRAQLCKQALSASGVGGEQAGFVDPELRLLTMAGGEFCVNACRALGALLHMLSANSCQKQRHEGRISTLSETILLEVDGAAPRWQSAAIFKAPAISFEKKARDEVLAGMSGISHLFLKTDMFPSAADAPKLAAKYFLKHGLDKEPASGVVWWRKKRNIAEIMPFVQVPEAGTAMLESACGSASMCLSLLLDSPTCLIRQPSGDILQISHDKDQISVSGPVRLICEGHIWLRD